MSRSTIYAMGLVGLLSGCASQELMPFHFQDRVSAPNEASDVQSSEPKKETPLEEPKSALSYDPRYGSPFTAYNPREDKDYELIDWFSRVRATSTRGAHDSVSFTSTSTGR